ncbi:MAG: hypothetical protein COZ49_02245 [Candidatus Yonathbacteria bacterium CG_4_10_14_3_um_filter_47_65]|uniref:Phospholipid/glycerol acyltransferase domain-containing protein n=2 Tax=Parcubacteria group TaxID=1794811 RepID=A0A2M8D5C5_9BACT|nr:MAG: hypothetical protein AUJ44_04085 [Candidatus Nomurabacteria bacterium CG1_02_47_685]PIP03818.1 MAG: hypothetical protein COX54_02420 [Candidatus Yonathbacteria bacterium CG23_combo_of_CG06-09_8_20_14_all_46_18]PIQ32536.1 MAG: hypothetical protein COW61_01560 [Candidatus Yonathbacteria bacterium CG17_big_fil_post_rev_8_21_14_2_50_46_19]PIX56432.1 MAG: hypothetical protein COZ49_02245 [Candidatus Yonathbacteria bacterium CG_4_10_14_3_um_filter_47_65]PIY57977.1 MAG: hypothetical protein CO
MHIYYIIPRILQTLIWIPTRVGLHLFARIKIKGKENIAHIRGGVVFVSNHASEADPILIPATLSPISRLFPIFYVSRTKKYYGHTGAIKSHIYGGRFFNFWGAYPAREGMRDYGKSLQYHLNILKKGHSVQIFPEGKKSPDGTIQDHAHGGAIYLAWRANVPIVPVAIKGTFQTNLFKFFLFEKKYAINYGKPIYPDELIGKKADSSGVVDFKNATWRVMDEVEKLYDEL